MALISEDITGFKIDKVQRSIDRIKAFEPEEGYFLGFSGGKDSIVIKVLADMAGVKYDAHYHVTTVDPPELTHFVREKHPDVILDRPKRSMRQIIIAHMLPPTMTQRFCCAELKEVNGKGRVTMTGARWAESVKRKHNQGLVTVFNGKKGEPIASESGAKYKLTNRGGLLMNEDNGPERRTVELCYRTNKTLVNPIIDWSDEDVWEFIKSYNIPYCSLYDEGFPRLGCIGCPLAGKEHQIRDFERWPYMYRMYLHAFDDMLKEREKRGKKFDKWTDAQSVMDWWLQNIPKKSDTIDGQINIDEL